MGKFKFLIICLFFCMSISVKIDKTWNSRDVVLDNDFYEIDGTVRPNSLQIKAGTKIIFNDLSRIEIENGEVNITGCDNKKIILKKGDNFTPIVKIPFYSNHYSGKILTFILFYTLLKFLDGRYFTPYFYDKVNQIYAPLYTRTGNWNYNAMAKVCHIFTIILSHFCLFLQLVCKYLGFRNSNLFEYTLNSYAKTAVIGNCTNPMNDLNDCSFTRMDKLYTKFFPVSIN